MGVGAGVVVAVDVGGFTLDVETSAVVDTEVVLGGVLDVVDEPVGGVVVRWVVAGGLGFREGTLVVSITGLVPGAIV